jgi:hypothetical protein
MLAALPHRVTALSALTTFSASLTDLYNIFNLLNLDNFLPAATHFSTLTASLAIFIALLQYRVAFNKIHQAHAVSAHIAKHAASSAIIRPIASTVSIFSLDGLRYHIH